MDFSKMNFVSKVEVVFEKLPAIMPKVFLKALKPFCKNSKRICSETYRSCCRKKSFGTPIRLFNVAIVFSRIFWSECDSLVLQLLAYTILCLLHHLWLPEFQWCIQQTALFHLNLSRSAAVEACDLPKVSCKFLTFFALVRSSCWRVFCKIGAFKSFAKFTGK